MSAGARRITSADNPLVKELVRLAGSRERRRAGLCILDGPHLVAAYAQGGASAEALVASDSGMERAEIRELFERVPARDRVILSDRLFAQAATVTTPVGILACVRVPAAATLPERIGDCVMLDAIQDAGNVGSILRSAAAAGFERVAALRSCAFFWSGRVLRAAMGAHFSLRLHEGLDADVLERCDAQILAATGAGESTLYELDLRAPTVWIFGNEGAGVEPRLLARAHRRVRIPIAASTESLNVAAAAAICLFEQLRQRRVQ